ncbi:hypothetical protein GE061_017073 [Apolygus lucorum]|uniref:Regulator of microtubule dynamics protein 1 n=1 Tax=Apolygus lucorum TaxID=248454 RepID=A0A8S9XLZ7_APOLU|nr:hypothetical protein GE061_017073 [Apolygus lucorum]
MVTARSDQLVISHDAILSTRPLKHSEIFVGGALLLSAGWFGKSGDRSSEGNQDVVTMADALYKQNRFREVYEILREHKDTDDVEILWRLSRVEYNISQEQKTPADEKKRLVLEAYELIEKALKLNGSHFATHKWMSILLDAKCGYDGLKARISNLETVKKHMMIASELNKKDATILYMIGLWCYQIADMPWYQRKIASTVFAKPPDSTYEEALEYFVRAEEVEPRFYSQNLLMLGKTYLKLKEEDKARYYLDLASNYPASTDDDQIARKEAHDLLKTLKPQKAESVAV